MIRAAIYQNLFLVVCNRFVNKGTKNFNYYNIVFFLNFVFRCF